jgi:hypothetical protein
MITDEGVPQVCESLNALTYEQLDHETVKEAGSQGRYIPPELLDDEVLFPLNMEMDIYGLGCVGLRVSVPFSRLAEFIINISISLYLIWFHMRMDLTTGRAESC